MRKPISHVYRQVAQTMGPPNICLPSGPSGHAMTPPGATASLPFLSSDLIAQRARDLPAARAHASKHTQ